MAETEHRIFPHGPPKEIAQGLWQVRGSLSFPLPRNMTMHRLADGGLLLVSVIAMNEEGMAELEKLGKPRAFLVPHSLHLMDAPFYARRYPDVPIIAAEDAAKRLEGKVKVSASPDKGLGELGVRFHVVPGLKFTEVVPELDVEGGKALVFTDLVSHGPRPKGVGGLMLKALGPPGGTGVPRIVKFRQVMDKTAVREFLRKMADLPDLKMVLSAHGAPITEDAAKALRDAADGV